MFQSSRVKKKFKILGGNKSIANHGRGGNEGAVGRGFEAPAQSHAAPDAKAGPSGPGNAELADASRV